MQDDAFHEIQLNGKQLVFLFMAATVVSVVIFLCGVLVGRGVRSARAAGDEAGTLTQTLTAPAVSQPSDQPAVDPVVAPEADPRAAAAPPEVDDLSYFSRLEDERPAVEELKPAAATPKPVPAPAAKPAPAPAERSAVSAAAAKPVPPPAPPPEAAPRRETPPAATSTPTAAAAATSKPPAQAPAAAPAPGDWAVQVAALNVRTEAEAVAKRLAAKGYAAYVVTPGGGTASVFRVRIGPFATRRDADAMALKLEKEEQFKPWVTR